MNNKMAKNTNLSTIESKKDTKQTRRIMDTECFYGCQMRGRWENGQKGEGIKKYK